MNPMQPARMQPANMFETDEELKRARLYTREKIFAIILQRQSQPVNDAQKQKFKEISKRIEEGLLKYAQTKDEYINQNTLESRLSNLIKHPTVNSHSQRRVQLVNSSSSVATMIPTPGMSHSGNSNLMASSVDTMMISSAGNDSIAPTVNAGTMLPGGGMHGTLSNGYQQSPANFAINAGANMSSMGVQRMTSQMIPTPGFNNNNNSQSYMNVESSNNGGGYSSVESIFDRWNPFFPNSD